MVPIEISLRGWHLGSNGSETANLHQVSEGFGGMISMVFCASAPPRALPDLESMGLPAGSHKSSRASTQVSPLSRGLWKSCVAVLAGSRWGGSLVASCGFRRWSPRITQMPFPFLIQTLTSAGLQSGWIFCKFELSYLGLRLD